MRRDRTAIDLALFVLGACLLGVTFGAIALMVAGCTSLLGDFTIQVGHDAKADCERVVDETDVEVERCSGEFRLVCDDVVSEDGDADVCIKMLAAAPCWELADVWLDRCQIFSGVR